MACRDHEHLARDNPRCFARRQDSLSRLRYASVNTVSGLASGTAPSVNAGLAIRFPGQDEFRLPRVSSIIDSGSEHSRSSRWRVRWNVAPDDVGFSDSSLPKPSVQCSIDLVRMPASQASRRTDDLNQRIRRLIPTGDPGRYRVCASHTYLNANST
jgi:hypothetical protein